VIDLKSLIKAGVHFGHQKSRRNPKMDPFVWGQRNNVLLFDVSKVAQALDQASRFIEEIASQGKTILWVCTKKAGREIIDSAAVSLNQPRVTHRWIGGTLTNFPQVKKSVTKMLHLEDVLKKNDSSSLYTKKDYVSLDKMYQRLNKLVGGFKGLVWPIGALVVIDVLKERTAIREAARMGIPVVALVDTNSDPSFIDYVIPGNDDAPRAIKVIVDELAQAASRGIQVAAEKKINIRAQQVQEQLEKDSTLAVLEKEVDEEGNQLPKRPTVAGRRNEGAANRSSAPRRPQQQRTGFAPRRTKDE
jgi:small subunit ribosomal protein S2